MKKIISFLIFSFAIISISQAQFKNLNLQKRDLSGYDRQIKIDKLITNVDSKPVVSASYTPMNAKLITNTSSFLTAEYNNDRPIWIGGVITGLDTRDINEASFKYLLEAKQMMGISEPLNEFVQQSVVIDEQQNRHIKMQQVYKDIPIYGQEIILHEKRGQIIGLNGVFTKTPALVEMNPKISVSQAKATIINDHAKPINPINTFIPGHENLQQWSQKLVILPVDNSFKLCYHYTVYMNIMDRMEYFIDAQTGAIINKHESICKLHNHSIELEKTHPIDEIFVSDESKTLLALIADPLDGAVTANAKDLYNNNVTINTYEKSGNFFMVDASRSMFNASSNMPDEPAGAIWTIDAFNSSPQNDNFSYDHVKSGNNGWSGDNGAVSAHFNGGKAYEYYNIVHGRNSIDGNKGNIISLVNISDEDGSSLGNAFWNGQAMFYGNGDSGFLPLARALDVAGHELTHGVIQNTANLVYQDEAGAINESMADVFGALIDRDDWRIGEDVVKLNAFPSGALRDLQDPHNGQVAGDYGKGFQPKHVNEMYTGTEDNGGVHLNSGIPNHAFYQFANVVGKDKAEKVYYKALSQYLTKSSQFVDLRIAVVKAAEDLYGTSTTEVNAAKNAFQSVGIGAGAGGDYENDYDNNPGDEYLVVIASDWSNLILMDKSKAMIANPFTNIAPLSKPSITDDGSNIVFVGQDNRMYLITIDWDSGNYDSEVLQSDPIWRNVVVSKDGSRIAALEDDINHTIHVYDFTVGAWNAFELYNPTYSEGVSTGDVQFADAMEFDPTGEWLMYDAKSEISGVNGQTISYWDIGFLNVWDNTNDLWGLGKVEKLFSALPEGISIGNPTFSKNSGYIVAFDHVETNDITIFGVNIETNTIGTIATDLFEPGYPNYGFNDQKVSYDLDVFGLVDLGITDMMDNKIDQSSPGGPIYQVDVRWGVFFSNGERDLTAIEQLVDQDPFEIEITPNPVMDVANIRLNSHWAGKGNIKIIDVNGRKVFSKLFQFHIGENELQIETEDLKPGNYFIQINLPQGSSTKKLVKIK